MITRQGTRGTSLQYQDELARLNLITHLLGRIPYKKLPRDKVKLPKRQRRGGYREPDYPFKRVPEVF